MNYESILMCVFAVILGMLIFHMLNNICGCKTVEGNTPTPPTSVESCQDTSLLIELNRRKYKEYVFNNNNNNNNKTEPDILILYYHGYNNCPNQIEPYIENIKGFCKNNYKDNKIVIASMLGNNYNGTSSWNISNYPKKYGTGYGINNSNINGCINASLQAIMGKTGNSMGDGCPKASGVCRSPLYNGCMWTSCSNDVQFTKDVINKYKKSNLNLKVYAIGFSTGAMFVYTLPNFVSEITKIVTFAGNIPFGLLVPNTNTSILDFHGDEDYTVPGITSSEKRKGDCNINNDDMENSMEYYLKKNYNITIDNNNIINHYTCDTDPHKYLYHNTNDLLIKISENKSSVVIDTSDLKKSFPNSLNIEPDGITKIYKYSDNVYSIEWGGGHGIPSIIKNSTNDSTPFNMAIEFFMKPG